MLQDEFHGTLLVNTGSVNDLVLLGSKPLAEPMLTQFYAAILWHQYATMSYLPLSRCHIIYPSNKVYGANMSPIWGWQDPGGSYVGPMNFAIWVVNFPC